MVTPDFLEVQEVIERGLPPRRVRVTESRAVVLGFTERLGWQVRQEVNNAVGEIRRLEADQVLVNTTAASIEPQLVALESPPGQTATTTIATLMNQEDVSTAIAELLVRDFLRGLSPGERSVVNVQQAVQAVAHQGVIQQL